MNPRITAVTPTENYTITLTFTNGEVRIFDVKPYLDKGIFQELKEPKYFNSVKPCLGSVQWKNGQDFCPDMLYEDSIPIGNVVDSDKAPDLPPDTFILRKWSDIVADDSLFAAAMLEFDEALSAAGYESDDDVRELVQKVKREQYMEWSKS